MPEIAKVLTTDAEIDAAIEQARRLERFDRRVIRASYSEGTDSIVLLLENGVTLSVPRRLLQGLTEASPGDLNQIELLGRVRKIEVTVAGFAMAPLFLVGTQRLTLMHGRLAEAMARQLPINFAPLPFPFPTLRQVIHHHHSRRNDPGVRWLLGELKIQAGLNA